MKKHLAALALGTTLGIGFILGSGAISAQKPTPVAAHRHFIVVNEEKVYLGPNFCDLDAAEQGFAGFHHKVHLTDPGINDVDSEGCPI